MGDMFDEDLIRELGLDPAEINGPKQEAPKKVDRPAPAKPATPSGAVPGASPVKPEATKPAATPDRPAAAKPPVRPGVPNSPWRTIPRGGSMVACFSNTTKNIRGIASRWITPPKGWKKSYTSSPSGWTPTTTQPALR